MPSASPFCVKLETYLRIVNLPYEVVFLNDPRKSPKGKLPFIEDKGKKISDTSLITRYLEQAYNYQLDNELSKEQRATSLAYQRLVEEHLYWIIAYSRWVQPDNWKITKAAYFNEMPSLIRQFAPEMIRKKVIKALHAQGIGRHTCQEIYQMACDDVTSISNMLGNKEYFFNNQPSTLDAIVFAFIIAIFYTHHYRHPYKNKRRICLI